MKKKYLIILLAILCLAFIGYKGLLIYVYDSKNNDSITMKMEDPILIETKQNTQTNHFQNIHFSLPKDFSLSNTYNSQNAQMYESENQNTRVIIGPLETTFLDQMQKEDKRFQYFEVQKLLKKYQIDNELELLTYYQEHKNEKETIFSKQSKIQMQYVARMYTENFMNGFTTVYYLDKDRTGVFVHNEEKTNYYVQILYQKKMYAIRILVMNPEEFSFDNVKEFLSSITFD